MRTDIRGSQLTSIKIGGPVASFWQPTSLSELEEALADAKTKNLPVKIIGGGSDLVLADEGFAGVLIQPAFKQLQRIEGEEYKAFLGQRVEVAARYKTQEDESFLKLENVEAESLGENLVYIELGAGVPWGQAVAWSLKEKLSGLQWLARVPCQVGGAVYNNIHSGQHFFSDSIVAVRAYDPETNEERVYGPSELEFGYDYSRFHRTKEIVLSVILALPEVSAGLAVENQQLYLDWTKEKARVQPSGANCGSVFKNLEQPADGQEAVAAAWYIDQCGFKGQTRGALQIYPGHANFIINTGEATQAEFIALLTEIRTAVQEKFGIVLEPEVECINEQGITYQWSQSSPTGSY